MTIIEAINKVDALKFNTYSQNDKITWLSKLDFAVKRLILDNHGNNPAPTFTGYTEDTPLNTVLLVPAPFDEIYLRWMEAQIDYQNGEYDRYNQSILMFKAEYDGFARWYNRNHMPLGGKMKYF
jgi:hypothetical protein